MAADHARRRSGETARGAVAALLACALVLGCRSPAPSRRAAVAYLDDAGFRRATLRASLVSDRNAYARLRLDHYATGRINDWDRLPEWNPASEPIAAVDLDRPGGAAAVPALSPAAVPLALPASSSAAGDDAGLQALGRAAFSRYPAQLAPYMAAALASRAAATRYGLWVDDQRGVGGLVRARMGDGSVAVALTCATCHAAPAAGRIEDGVNNAALDLGAAILTASPSAGANLPASATAADSDGTRAIAAWGAGRVDVTTSAGTEPARIPDLRPVRYLTHLHQDGTLIARDRTTLAIRIETLIITSHGQALRPPRIVALALAQYLLTLADRLPALDAGARRSPRGASVFAAQCASCHASPGLAGPPIALDVIGTDATLGRSVERGTGGYRVPSLRGVGTRTPLLHDGTVASLAVMFDPARTGQGFAARLHGGPGAVPGHRFGLALDEGDRRALLSFLGAL